MAVAIPLKMPVSPEAALAASTVMLISRSPRNDRLALRCDIGKSAVHADSHGPDGCSLTYKVEDYG
jgi:hypothetical protein